MEDSLKKAHKLPTAHIHFQSESCRKGNACLAMFLENLPKSRSQQIWMNNPIIPLTLDLNIGKKKFLHHCCSPPLMKWTHSRNGNKLKSLTYSFILQKSEGIWKEKVMEGRKKSQRKSVSCHNCTPKISQTWVQIPAPQWDSKRI